MICSQDIVDFNTISFVGLTYKVDTFIVCRIMMFLKSVCCIFFFFSFLQNNPIIWHGTYFFHFLFFVIIVTEYVLCFVIL